MAISEVVGHESFHLLCGWQLGGGMSRTVYSCNLLPDSVVKVEERGGNFQNIVEWETWSRVRDTKFAKWFAPCSWISPTGAVLIMARTSPAELYPSEMPAFFCDFKRENYGRYNGCLVCHDYGTNMLFEFGMTKRMKKVEWW